jgi:hypothetical protein
MDSGSVSEISPRTSSATPSDLDDPFWAIGPNVKVDKGDANHTKLQASDYFINGIPASAQSITGDELKKQITQDNLKIMPSSVGVSCVKYVDPTGGQSRTRIVVLFDIVYNSDPDDQGNSTTCYLHFGQEASNAPTGISQDDPDDVQFGSLKVGHYHKIKRKNLRFTYHTAVFK